MSHPEGYRFPLRAVLTPGQVARALGCSVKVVHGWCEKLGLKFHFLPNGKWRRIERHHLIEFLTRYGVPVPPELRQPEPTPGDDHADHRRGRGRAGPDRPDEA